MWCRRSMPLRGSIERRSAGNTYCQPQSRDAAGYLRSSANGPDGAASFQQVHRVQPLRLPQLAAQQANETIGQHRDAILGAFPVAHQNFPALEVDIFDPQSDRFHDPHARAVQQFREEPVVAPEAIEQPCRLGSREHRGQARGRLCPDDTVEPRQLADEDLPIEEKQRALRLILRRCSDLQFRREVREEFLDVACRQFRRVAIAVEANEAFDPVDVRLLGSKTVMLEPYAGPDLVKQTRADRCHGCAGLLRRTT